MIGHSQTSARARRARQAADPPPRLQHRRRRPGRAALRLAPAHDRGLRHHPHAMNASPRSAPEPRDHRHRQQRHQRVHLRPQTRQLHPAAARPNARSRFCTTPADDPPRRADRSSAGFSSCSCWPASRCSPTAAPAPGRLAHDGLEEKPRRNTGQSPRRLMLRGSPNSHRLVAPAPGRCSRWPLCGGSAPVPARPRAGSVPRGPPSDASSRSTRAGGRLRAADLSNMALHDPRRRGADDGRGADNGMRYVTSLMLASPV